MKSLKYCFSRHDRLSSDRLTLSSLVATPAAWTVPTSSGRPRKTIFQRLLIFIMVSLIGILISPLVRAEQISVPIDRSCHDQNIETYLKGELEYVCSGGEKKDCVAVFDLAPAPKVEITPEPNIPPTANDPHEPIISQPLVSDWKEALDRANPFGDGSQGWIGAGKSLIAPFAAMYSALPSKRSLGSIMDLLSNHTSKYHDYLDREIFGKAIASVTEKKSSEDLAEFLKASDGKCDASNPKPQCVMGRAMCSYEVYVNALFSYSGRTPEAAAIRSGADINQLLALTSARSEALSQEAADTQAALDSSLAVNGQFFETYRLHLQFKAFIAALVKVRDLTSRMADLVSCIPNKFVGVATTECN